MYQDLIAHLDCYPDISRELPTQRALHIFLTIVPTISVLVNFLYEHFAGPAKFEPNKGFH